MNLVERYLSVSKEPPETKLKANLVVLNEKIKAKWPVIGEEFSFLNWRKHFGSLSVTAGCSRIEVIDEENEINLRLRQNVAELHLIPPGRHAVSKVISSMKELAEYIEKKDLPVIYVLGLTYERLANVSKRFGFKVLDYPLTQDDKESLKKSLVIYQKAGLIDDELGDFKLIIQRRSDF